MNIGVVILAIVGGTVGILSSVYLLLSLPAIIIWKFYRRIRFGISMNK